MAEYYDLENKKIIVLVPGLPGWGLNDHSYWDTLTFDSHWTREINAKLVLVQPGAMSSHHDRACEIFAQLMGVRTDYGSQHSETAGHSRFGRDFTNNKNIKCVWSAENPIGLLCHCTGTNTARYLQYLLSMDFWNCNTNEKWIDIVVSINGNINGTQFMHFFDISSIDGVGSQEALLRATKQVYNGAMWAVNRKKNLTDDQKHKVVDWHLSHWGIDTNTKKWFQNLDSKPKFLSNNDNLFYDLTVHGCQELNDKVNSFEGTFYFGFYSQATDYDSKIPISHQLNPLLFKSATYLLHTSFSKGPLGNKVYHTKRWRNNDGMYSVACQSYPMNCTDHQELASFSDVVQKGCWYHGNIQLFISTKCVVDHLSMVWSRTFLKPHTFQVGSDDQKLFYIHLLTFLSKLQ